jgi:uncharacterized protein with PQ loop repeat
MDGMAYAAGLAGNLAAVPQVIRVWQGSAPGVSIDTWVMYLILAVVWLVYAVKIKQRPLILAQIGSLVVNLSVVIGWFLHN